MINIDIQAILNIIISAFGAFALWLFKIFHLSIKEKEINHNKLAEKVNLLEVTIVGNYVKNVDLEKALLRVFMQLQRIEDKIDKKEDKHGRDN